PFLRAHPPRRAARRSCQRPRCRSRVGRPGGVPARSASGTGESKLWAGGCTARRSAGGGRQACAPRARAAGGRREERALGARPQLDMFGTVGESAVLPDVADILRDRLLEADLDGLSPRDAHALLRGLKKLAG